MTIRNSGLGMINSIFNQSNQYLTPAAAEYLRTSEVGLPIKEEVETKIRYDRPFLVPDTIVPLQAQRLTLAKQGYKTWNEESVLVKMAPKSSSYKKSAAALYVGNNPAEYISSFVKHIKDFHGRRLLSAGRLLRVRDLKISYVNAVPTGQIRLLLQCRSPQNTDAKLLVGVHHHLCANPSSNEPLNEFNSFSVKLAPDFVMFRKGIMVSPPQIEEQWIDILGEEELVMADVTPCTAPHNINNTRFNQKTVKFALHRLFL